MAAAFTMEYMRKYIARNESAVVIAATWHTGSRHRAPSPDAVCFIRRMLHRCLEGIMMSVYSRINF